jgi:hypothetical protein
MNAVLSRVRGSTWICHYPEARSSVLKIWLILGLRYNLRYVVKDIRSFWLRRSTSDSRYKRTEPSFLLTSTIGHDQGLFDGHTIPPCNILSISFSMTWRSLEAARYGTYWSSTLRIDVMHHSFGFTKLVVGRLKKANVST